MKFSDIKFRCHGIDPEGVHAIVRFKNGYGLSVVRHSCSYGNAKGLYEVALLKIGTLKGASQENDWDLVLNDKLGYPDVRGWLSEKDVEHELDKIENAPQFEDFDNEKMISFSHVVPTIKQ
jgi:hypothetical protein